MTPSRSSSRSSIYLATSEPRLPSLACRFFPIDNVAKGRKRWILSVPVRGQLWLDTGAVRAVKDRHKSLFAPGILKVGLSKRLSHRNEIKGDDDDLFITHPALSLT
jgi:glutamate 5-kinase